MHEIKQDGYRIIARKIGDRVQLITKGGYDWTKRYPWIAEATRRLSVLSAVIDGEAVVCDPDGVSDFERLHCPRLRPCGSSTGSTCLNSTARTCDRCLEGRKAKLERVIRKAG